MTTESRQEEEREEEEEEEKEEPGEVFLLVASLPWRLVLTPRRGLLKIPPAGSRMLLQMMPRATMRPLPRHTASWRSFTSLTAPSSSRALEGGAESHALARVPPKDGTGERLESRRSRPC